MLPSNIITLVKTVVFVIISVLFFTLIILSRENKTVIIRDKDKKKYRHRDRERREVGIERTRGDRQKQDKDGR